MQYFIDRIQEIKKQNPWFADPSVLRNGDTTILVNRIKSLVSVDENARIQALQDCRNSYDKLPVPPPPAPSNQPPSNTTTVDWDELEDLMGELGQRFNN